MTRMTELDDAVEQVLGRYIGDTFNRIEATREVLGLLHAATGVDVYAQVPQPPDIKPAQVHDALPAHRWLDVSSFEDHAAGVVHELCGTPGEHDCPGARRRSRETGEVLP